MLPKEVPCWAKELLDGHAGKENSENGAVMRALAEILTTYQEALDDVRSLSERFLRDSLSTDCIALAEGVLEVLDDFED